MSRAEAARLSGMQRQALRDAVARFNAEGLAGLHNRPHPGPAPRLDAAGLAALKQLVLDRPDAERAGLSAWTLADLCREVEQRLGRALPPRLHERAGVEPGLVAPEGARPAHPKRGPDAQAAFAKGGFGRAGRDPGGASRQAPDALVPEQRQGWPERAHLFAAVRPSTGQDFVLVVPAVSTRTTQVFLDGFAARLAPDEHAAMVLDQAGWHSAYALIVPANVTLVPLKPYAPELDSVERVWLHLRERHLSHRLPAD